MKVTREQIIKKALTLFATSDYESVSLNDIAGALDITKGGIYHYFSSKDELFKEAVLFTFNNIEDSMNAEALGEGSVSEVLGSLFDLEELSKTYAHTLGINVMEDYKSVVYLMFTAMKKYPEVAEKLRNSYETIIKAIEYFLNAAAEKGEIRKDLDFKALSFLISAYIEGGMLIGGMGVEPDCTDISRRVFDMFWAFISDTGNGKTK